VRNDAEPIAQFTLGEDYFSYAQQFGVKPKLFGHSPVLAFYVLIPVGDPPAYRYAQETEDGGEKSWD